MAPTCKDCAYFRPDPMMRLPGLTRCAHPSKVTEDVVLGKSLMPFAADQRLSNGPCGPSGTLFLPETNPLKRLFRGRTMTLLGAGYFTCTAVLLFRL